MKPKVNRDRLTLAIAFLVVGFGIGIGVLYRYDFLLHSKPTAPSHHFDRFLWSVASAFIGFGVLAFRLRTNQNKAYTLYLTYYLPVLLMMAALVTAMTFLVEDLNGAGFFYFAFAVGFLAGLFVDSLRDIVARFVKQHTA
jgi:hypothetical protein